MWTPTDYLLNSVFATDEDLAQSVDKLCSTTGGPVVVAVFSARWLLPSLSRFVAGDGTADEDAAAWFHAALKDRLRDSEDKFAFVEKTTKEALQRSGCEPQTTLRFGGNLDRPGGIAVVIGGRYLKAEPAASQAELVAMCTVASRPAAFSLDTSLELAFLSELREATDKAQPAAPSLTSTAASDATAALMAFASTILGTHALVAYEADSESPHRFVHLERKFCVPKLSDYPSWLPREVRLTPDLGIPAPPELGGSKFESLTELVDHCFSSNDRPRPLVADIATEYSAYGIPYGFDDVRRRPIGVLCLVWSRATERELGPYELSASRMVALHLARGYDKRHSDSRVTRVTSQLAYISDLPTSSEAQGVIQCDEILLPRRDVKLIAPSVAMILEGLVKHSGAMSVTCRILTGAGGPNLSRYLARLHSTGDDCAIKSPDQIAIADTRSSVNAWVATTGRAVYLRTVTPSPEAERYTSPDLASYDGLDSVAIYREGVECELCVPILAERRIVGTVNLEADRTYAFDMAETVAEYAQLIGIALLEARRRIAVETVTEIEGYLDYRHRLDHELAELTKAINDSPELVEEHRSSQLAAVRTIHDLVFMRRVPEIDQLGPCPSVESTISSAMRSLDWATKTMPIDELLVDRGSRDAQAVLSAHLDRESARALAFAVAQALHNIRDHGGEGDSLAGLTYPAMFRLGETPLGGKRNLYVAVASTCDPSAFERIHPQQVFRQPIDHADRVSLGAFLAGEALRRCGGSAYLRVTPSDEHDPIVNAEFSVPAAT